jgi:hypothetical protein
VSDADQPAVRPIDPDDVGIGTVQQSGLVYVGKEHAGAEVRWALEVQDESE